MPATLIELDEDAGVANILIKKLIAPGDWSCYVRVQLLLTPMLMLAYPASSSFVHGNCVGVDKVVVESRIFLSPPSPPDGGGCIAHILCVLDG
jgi:hypothetical protein